MAPPYRLFYKSIALTLLPASLLCSPLNNVYDSQPLYNHLCSDKVYRKHKGMEINFSLSPLYQHANTARNSDGSKVPGGDRLGEWNFFGLFFDDGHNAGTSLASKPIGTNYTKLKAAQDAIGGVTIQNNTSPTRYRIGNGIDPATPGTLHGAGDLTVKSQFSKLKAPFAYASVPTSYEKIGIRGHMSVELALGLGFSVRGGAVEIKNKPRQFVARQLLIDTGFITGEGIPAPSADDTADATIIYNALFADQKPRNDVAEELHYNLKLFHKNSPEDVHAQLFWHLPLAFHEKSGDLAVTMVPYVAVGAWIPLSEKFDHDNAFAVPFGNMQQTFGLTADAAVSFDFPVLPASGNGKQSFGISFGGGALLFGAVTDTDQRFPSSEFQQGLIPWKVASIRRSPGATWYINTSLKAEEFIEGLSLYADYCYTQHLSDSITISDVTAKKTLFQDGVARSQDDSAWKNQQLSFGFNYAITNNISLNAAAQGHISGVLVYRTTTLLGGLTVTF
jgi:hypothetical protein